MASSRPATHELLLNFSLSFPQFLNKRSKYAPLVHCSPFLSAASPLARWLREFLFAGLGADCGRAVHPPRTARLRVQTRRERPDRRNGRLFAGGQSERKRLLALEICHRPQTGSSA